MALLPIQYIAGVTLNALLAVLPATDRSAVLVPIHGVHAPGPAVAELVTAGRQRSPTFRALVRELDRSDWIVFVQTGSCLIPAVSSCLLHRIGTFHGVRYLRIVLSDLPPSSDEAIATIGHELRHALEVVNAPDVSAAPDTRGLYRRIGYVARRTPFGDSYETPEAQTAGAMILRELQAPGHVAEDARRTVR